MITSPCLGVSLSEFDEELDADADTDVESDVEADVLNDADWFVGY